MGALDTAVRSGRAASSSRPSAATGATSSSGSRGCPTSASPSTPTARRSLAGCRRRAFGSCAGRPWATALTVGVPLAFSSGLVVSGLVYGVFFIMVLIGIRDWLGRYRNREVVAI